MEDRSNVIPSYKNKDFFETRTDIILKLAGEISPIMNELHNKSYSNDYWLNLLNDHIKVCVNRTAYLLEEGYYEPILMFPINSFLPLGKKEICKHNIIYILKAIKNKTNLNLEIEKIYLNRELLFGARANEMKKYIDGVKIKSLQIFGIFFKIGNINKRKKLTQMSENINDLVLKKIVLSLPKILVEHYDYINGLFEVKEANEKRFHFEHRDSILSDFIIAKYRESGAKVISYQLGGFMGETFDNPSKIFYRLCDEFHTYGWKVHEKDVPSLPFRLMEYKRHWDESRSQLFEKKNNKKILVVFSIVNPATIQGYLDFSKSFFQKIPKRLFQDIIIRLRPNSLHINKNAEAEKLNIPSAITIDVGKDKMAVSAAKAGIIILTSLPATTFLECIYVGQPVIAVNTNNNPSVLFARFVPDLERLGILHRSALSLTEYLLTIEVYSEWWEKIQQDEVFQEFTLTFTGRGK